MSRQGLEAGKELLHKLLGNRVKHRRDHFKDLRESLDELDWEDEENGADEKGWEVEEDVSIEAETVGEEMRERLTLRWLDTPDPRGVTPRQAAQTAEGREELRETMKIFEFLEDQALKSGNRPPMRLDIIRKELGL
jgi:DNA-binding PadR family transcriptional regulator